MTFKFARISRRQEPMVIFKKYCNYLKNSDCRWPFKETTDITILRIALAPCRGHGLTCSLKTHAIPAGVSLSILSYASVNIR